MTTLNVFYEPREAGEPLARVRLNLIQIRKITHTFSFIASSIFILGLN